MKLEEAACVECISAVVCQQDTFTSTTPSRTYDAPKTSKVTEASIARPMVETRNGTHMPLGILLDSLSGDVVVAIVPAVSAS